MTKYFIDNEKINGEINTVLRQIRLSMNGENADNMTKYGANYEKNYGVLLPRLREIAKEFEPDIKLAERLWYLNIRETKIMACLLCPPASITVDKALEWAEQIRTYELAEMSAMLLFSKTKHVREITYQWLKTNNKYINYLGLMTATKSCSLISDDDCVKMLHTTVFNQIDDPNIAHGIEVYMESVVQWHPSLISLIEKQLLFYQANENNLTRYIVENIREEIDFSQKK